MHSIKNALLYGFLLWLFPFLIAILIYPIHENNRTFFETIMPISLTFFTITFTVLYFRNLNVNFLKEGIFLGLIFFAISLILDLFMFMPESPMKMSFANYMMDIGFTYLMFPTITIGFGWFLENRKT